MPYDKYGCCCCCWCCCVYWIGFVEYVSIFTKALPPPSSSYTGYEYSHEQQLMPFAYWSKRSFCPKSRMLASRLNTFCMCVCVCMFCQKPNRNSFIHPQIMPIANWAFALRKIETNAYPHNMLIQPHRPKAFHFGRFYPQIAMSVKWKCVVGHSRISGRIQISKGNWNEPIILKMCVCCCCCCVFSDRCTVLRRWFINSNRFGQLLIDSIQIWYRLDHYRCKNR